MPQKGFGIFIHFLALSALVLEPTHLQIGSSPQFSGWKQKMFELPPPIKGPVHGSIREYIEVVEILMQNLRGLVFWKHHPKRWSSPVFRTSSTSPGSTWNSGMIYHHSQFKDTPPPNPQKNRILFPGVGTNRKTSETNPTQIFAKKTGRPGANGRRTGRRKPGWQRLLFEP